MGYINVPMRDLEENLDCSGIITYVLHVPSRTRALSVAITAYTSVITLLGTKHNGEKILAL